MSPSISSQDYVMILKYPFCFFLLQKNRIGVFESSSYGTILKRIVRVHRPTGVLWAESINPSGISSEQIGKIPFSKIRGIVIKHFHP
ncbi:MAG: hypothetical protein CSA35_07945 [Dethiosulfovibrio peptidovorans]|nr:MAG: hypothetical protein CSA35_07945 [Dethiosulfovibrio peptidovorans]